MADYKHTINLPNTGFPMKADLAHREPGMLAAWERSGLYEKIRGVAKGRPSFNPLIAHVLDAAAAGTLGRLDALA